MCNRVKILAWHRDCLLKIEEIVLADYEEAEEVILTPKKHVTKVENHGGFQVT